MSAILRSQLTPQRFAQVAIAVEFLAAVRTLAEIYRLRGGLGFTLDAAMPYLTGAFIALGFVAVSLLCYFAGRARSAGLFAVVMIVVLVAYKALAIPGG